MSLNRHERRRLAATRANTYGKQPYVAATTEIAHALRDAGMLRPGTTTEVAVFHDSDCPALHGGFCECKPDYRVLLPDGRMIDVAAE